MNQFTKLLILFISTTFISCFEEDVYSDVPEIEFVDLKFYDSDATDSLVLTFNFTDGDANVGSNDNDLIPQYLLYFDSENTIVTEANLDQVQPPIFKAPIIFEYYIPRFRNGNSIAVDQSDGTFPVFVSDSTYFSNEVSDIVFECPGLINQNGVLFDTVDVALYDIDQNFVYSEINVQDLDSTVPAEFVENFYNFIIRFERKVGNKFETINFREDFGSPFCEIGNFNGNIPWFDPQGKSGTITYNMQSLLFRLGLQDDVFRIRFFVYDRAGNKSNVVISPSFILSDITIIQ